MSNLALTLILLGTRPANICKQRRSDSKGSSRVAAPRTSIESQVARKGSGKVRGLPATQELLRLTTHMNIC